jgi:hypothetical protein
MSATEKSLSQIKIIVLRNADAIYELFHFILNEIMIAYALSTLYSF